jgi:hypothetical protein
MKIGILTFHEGLNHGAYLQAFALMKELQAMGHEVEIINYKNREHWLKEDVRPWFSYRRPIRFVDRWRKQKAFKNDHQLMSLSRFTKDARAVRQMHYDAVVVGSDVVWNYKIFGFDDLYFGNLPARRKVAYAASFGWINYGEDLPKGVVEGLRSFDSISVRDVNTRRIVETVTKEKPAIVLDPTLLYEFAQDEVVTPRIEKLGRYALVYCYIDEDSVIDTVREYASVRGLKLVSVGYRQFWCEQNIMDAGPTEWLGLYHHATFIVSSTFHGTIFALKNEKEFAYVRNVKAHNRIVSLADICGLSHQFFDSGDAVALIAPDYKDVNDRLHPLIAFSRAWLRSALD